jgi:uncharacterized protein YndB with AHSA1/START domain
MTFTLSDNWGSHSDHGDHHELRYERRLRAPIERVWRAITEPDELRVWWGTIDVDLALGGRFNVRWDNADATMDTVIVALEPPHLLEIATAGDKLDWDAVDPDDPMNNPTRMRFQLAEAGDGGTELTLTVGIVPRELRPETASGWHAHLDLLAEVAEGTRTAPEDPWLPTNFDEIRSFYAALLGEKAMPDIYADEVLAENRAKAERG